MRNVSKIISTIEIIIIINRINRIVLPTPILFMSFIDSKIFKASLTLPVFANLASPMDSRIVKITNKIKPTVIVIAKELTKFSTVMDIALTARSAELPII